MIAIKCDIRNCYAIPALKSLKDRHIEFTSCALKQFTLHASVNSIYI